MASSRKHFASVAVDLIFAAPGETLGNWGQDLQTCIDDGCHHVSTYGLTYEKGAAFWSRREKGRLQSADEELERRMYEWAIDRLTAAGFEHYEVSNFARSGHRCRHNECYWTGRGYYAVGPGAARYVDGRRELNHRSLSTYLKRVLAGRSPVAEGETLGPEDAAREQLVFSLRRLGGVAKATFARETGYPIEQLAGSEVRRFRRWGLLEETATHLRLTRSGLLVSDSIWPAMLRR